MKEQLTHIIQDILGEDPDMDYTYGDMRLRVEYQLSHENALSETAHDTLDTDPELQTLMTSRDPNLPSFRNHMVRFMEYNFLHDEGITRSIVLHDFINFARWYDIEDAYPYEADIDGYTFTFPGKRVFAYWKSLEHLLK